MTPANQNDKHCNIDDFFWHVDQLGYARRGWDSIARGICSETYLKFYWYLQQEIIAREIMVQIRRESVKVVE